MHEVQRNKILVVAEFLSQKIRELTLQTFNVPDHLSGTTAGQRQAILKKMGSIVETIKSTNKEAD